MTYIDDKTLNKLLENNNAIVWCLFEQKKHDFLFTLKPEKRFMCFLHGRTKTQLICHVDKIKLLKAKNFAKVAKVIPVEMRLTLLGVGVEAGDNFGTYEVGDYAFSAQFVDKS